MKKRTFLGFAPGLILCSILYCASASGTSFFIRPFSQFTQSTSNIARGTLRNIHVENGITQDGAKTIYTYATLEVKEVMKGTLPHSQILLRKIGGSKDGVTLEIPSAAEFTEGEEGVFFLSSQQNDKSYEVTGMELGKFGVKESGGETILTGGIFNYSQTSSPEVVNNEDLSENRRPWSLGQLRELIQKQGTALQDGNGKNPRITQSVKHPPNSLPTETIDAKRESQVPAQNFPPSLPESHDTSLPYKWGIASLIAIGLYVLFRRRERGH